MDGSDNTYKELADIAKEEKTGFLRFLPWLIGLIVVAAGLLWFSGILSPVKDKEAIQVAQEEKKPVLYKKRIIQPIEKPKPITTSENGSTAISKDEPITPESSQPIAEPKDETVPAPDQNQHGPTPVQSSPLPPPVDTQMPSDISPVKVESYPYSLHMGSYRTLKHTEEYISELKAKGLSPYYTVVDLGEKGVWHRVFVGHFKSPQLADAFQFEHNIKADRIINTDHAVQIGLYTSMKELDKKRSALKQYGYCPYIIEQPQGRYQLLVGAFQTKNAAEALAAKIRSAGMECTAISR